MTMKRINIHEAKANLSKYLKNLEQEGKIIICKYNVPIAEIVPINSDRKTGKRPIGLAQDEFEIPPSFFEDLPEEVIDSFYNGQT